MNHVSTPIALAILLNNKRHSLTLAGDVLPYIIGKSDSLYQIGKMLHGEVMEIIVLTIIGGHIAAALYHQFIKKDKIMSRIKP